MIGQLTRHRRIAGARTSRYLGKPSHRFAPGPKENVVRSW
jgi:hypothetical protein